MGLSATGAWLPSLQIVRGGLRGWDPGQPGAREGLAALRQLPPTPGGRIPRPREPPLTSDLRELKTAMTSPGQAGMEAAA